MRSGSHDDKDEKKEDKKPDSTFKVLSVMQGQINYLTYQKQKLVKELDDMNNNKTSRINLTVLKSMLQKKIDGIQSQIDAAMKKAEANIPEQKPTPPTSVESQTSVKSHAQTPTKLEVGTLNTDDIPETRPRSHSIRR